MLPLLFPFLPFVLANSESDLVTNLPGLKSMPAFKIYSGYLNANLENTKKMHYFLAESKTNPSTDPIVFWFNGGPGASSLLFTENGPFNVGRDGESLVENVYSWNARANLVALESPVQVGFSFDLRNETSEVNDDSTAEQNYQAIKKFFEQFDKKFGNRRFFVTGESYAGIYVPMLTKNLIEGINNGDFPNKNFEGAAIGNGNLDIQSQKNGEVIYMAHHGKLSSEDWDRAKVVCRTNNETDPEKFDFLSFFEKENSSDPNERECAEIVNAIFDLWAALHIDPLWINQGITDPLFINEDNTTKWNLIERAEYINKNQEYMLRWRGKKYNNTINSTYTTFRYIYENAKADFRFLIYNGDLDRACSYIGNQWFVRDLAGQLSLKSDRQKPWRFAHQVAGFQHHYSGKNQYGRTIRIDMVTVKGSGHMVPTDRPGPSRQMITNFIFSKKNEIIDYGSQRQIGPNPMPRMLDYGTLLGIFRHLDGNDVISSMLACREFYNIIHNNWNLMKRRHSKKFEIKRTYKGAEVVFKLFIRKIVEGDWTTHIFDKIELKIENNCVKVALSRRDSGRTSLGAFFEQQANHKIVRTEDPWKCGFSVPDASKQEWLVMEFPVESMDDGLRRILMYILPRVQFTHFRLSHVHDHYFTEADIKCIAECVQATRPLYKQDELFCHTDHFINSHPAVVSALGCTAASIELWDNPLDEKVLALPLGETEIQIQKENLDSLHLVRTLLKEWYEGRRDIKRLKIIQCFSPNIWYQWMLQWNGISAMFDPVVVKTMTKNDVRFRIGRASDDKILDIFCSDEESYLYDGIILIRELKQRRVLPTP